MDMQQQMQNMMMMQMMNSMGAQPTTTTAAGGRGRGRGAPGTPYVPLYERDCFNWLATPAYCRNGDVCPYKHGDKLGNGAPVATAPAAAAAATGGGTATRVLTGGDPDQGVQKKTQPEEEPYGQTLDYGKLKENDAKDAATLTIVDTREVCSYLSSTAKTDAGIDSLLFRVSAAPNILRPQFLKLAQLLHPQTTTKDGAQLGTKMSLKLMNGIIENLETLQMKPVHVRLPRDLAEPDEENETINHVMAELLKEIKADRASRIETPREVVQTRSSRSHLANKSPLTPMERRARKQQRTKEKLKGRSTASSSSSSRVPVPPLNREALFKAMQPDGESSETESYSEEEADDDDVVLPTGIPAFPILGTPPVAAAPPAAQPAPQPRGEVTPLVADAMNNGMTQEQETAGWVQMNDMKNVVTQLLPNYKPCSDSQKEPYTDETLFGGCAAPLKPRNPVGPGGPMLIVSPKDLGALAYLFTADDFQTSRNRVYEQVLASLKDSKAPNTRLIAIGKHYGVDLQGRFSYKVTITIVALAIAKAMRLGNGP